MFGKLFGAKPPPKQEVDAGAAAEKLRGKIENIGMRKKKVENETAKFKAEAMAKYKKGDKSGAALAMKKMKMREKEVIKLEGQEIIMEQQANQIESSKFDQAVFADMKAGQ